MKTKLMALAALAVIAVATLVHLFKTTEFNRRGEQVAVAAVSTEAAVEMVTVNEPLPVVPTEDANLVRVRVAKLSFASGPRPLGRGNTTVTVTENK